MPKVSDVLSERERRVERMEELLKAPDDQVRAILRALCDDVTTRRKAVEYFDKIQSRAGAADAPQESLQICVQCEWLFTPKENGPQACKYHPGRLILDYSAECWADADDWMFDGLEDDPDMQEENPEGFQYSCCWRYLSDDVPCTVGRHESDPSSAGKEADGPYGSEDGATFKDGDDDEEKEEENENEDEGEENEGPPRKKRVM